MNSGATDTFAALKLEYLAGMSETLEALEQEFLDLERCERTTGQFVSVARRVHSIKGSAGSFEMPILSQICHQMEDELQLVSASTGESIIAGKFLSYVDLMRKVCTHYKAVLTGGTPSHSDQDFTSLLRALRPRERINALLIDPSRTTHSLVAGALSHFPVNLHWCADGISGLARIANRNHSLILIAKTVPQIDGAQLIACASAIYGDNAPAIALIASDEKFSPVMGIQPTHRLIRDNTLRTQVELLVKEVLESQGNT